MSDGWTLTLTRDPEEFAARAGEFLAQRIECNILSTVLMQLRGRPPVGAQPLFGYAAQDGGIRYAALRTPPWPLLVSPLDGDAARELVELWLTQDPDVPRVNGPLDSARAVAAAWAQRTGGTTRCRTREAMHVLHEVRDPPRPARGDLRAADPSERRLLVGWMRAFAQEAGLIGADQAEAIVDGQMAQAGLWLWHDDDGEPTSMVGVRPAVGGVVRLGPVYTPPEHRRRGYAGSAVAASSRLALERGADTCSLFTDLANPTSNKIYAEVGYRRVSEWEEHEFSSPEPRVQARG